jgi:hypothetical protein
MMSYSADCPRVFADRGFYWLLCVRKRVFQLRPGGCCVRACVLRVIDPQPSTSNSGKYFLREHYYVAEMSFFVSSFVGCDSR